MTTDNSLLSLVDLTMRLLDSDQQHDIMYPKEIIQLQKIVSQLKGEEVHVIFRQILQQCYRKAICSLNNAAAAFSGGPKPNKRMKISNKATKSTQSNKMEHNGVTFFKRYVMEWEKYKTLIRCLSYAFARIGGVSTRSLAFEYFQSLYLCFEYEFRRSLVQYIREAREEVNESDDDENLVFVKRAIHAILELNPRYVDELKRNTIQECVSDYESLACSWSYNCSCSHYLFKVETFIDKELHLLYESFDSSEPKLLEIMQHKFLTNSSLGWLKKAGYLSLFQVDAKLDLERLGRILSGMDHAFTFLASAVIKDLRTRGKALVQDAKKAAAFNGVSASAVIKDLRTRGNALVQDAKKAAAFNGELFMNLLELLEKYDGPFMLLLRERPTLLKDFEDIFRDLFDKEIAGITLADSFLYHIDDILINMDSAEKMGEQAPKELCKILRMTMFIRKDLYMKKLAGRLLSNLTNIGIERHIVSELSKLGHPLASDMVKMIDDLSMSKEMSDRFSSSMERKQLYVFGLDFTVTNLDEDCWRMLQSYSSFKPPKEMVEPMALYEKFFTKQNPGFTDISFLYSEGNCFIEMDFETQTVELAMLPVQAAVILLFTNQLSLTYNDILTRLNLEKKILTRVLDSLSCSDTCNILMKIPRNKAVSEVDYFVVNSQFKSEMGRCFQVPRPLEPTRTVERERGTDGLDASILKIMKVNGKLSHTLLRNECDLELDFEVSDVYFEERVRQLVRFGFISDCLVDGLYGYKFNGLGIAA